MALRKTAVISGEKYPPEYVDLMRAMIPDIVILGESWHRRDRPLQTPLTGWWSKLEIFAPWNRDLRPCVNFDLDTFILDPGAVRDLCDLCDGLWLLRDFNHPQRGESGIFVAPTDSEEIWLGAMGAFHDKAYYGDGQYLNTLRHKKIQDSVDGIKSYKVNQLYDDPKDARIVCFHGKPKPHETEGWARDFWITKTLPTKN